MTLISIVGDFHSSILPITYEFKEEIDRHVIVYDNASREIAEIKRLIAGQQAYLNSFPSDSRVHYDIHTMQIDEDSYESIHQCFERILVMEENAEALYLNTTDGLSSIAVVLSSELLAAGGKVISYDRYDNTYNLHTRESMYKHPIRHNMDIWSHLTLKGYTIKRNTAKESLEARKDAVLKLTENLPAFKRFANSFQGKHSSDEVFGNDQYKRLLKSIGMLENTFYIQGSVFEEYIYHLVCEHFDFDDVWQGTTVVFTEQVENEFDILMIKDNHLHTIECKFKKDLDGKPMIYKMELLIDYLDDDGKAMILNIGGNNENADRRNYPDVKFDKGDRARARYGDIKIHQEKEFNEKKFLKDVKNWFL